jgi:cytochrome c oxidase subunit 2
MTSLLRRFALAAVVVGSLAAGAGLAACGDDGGSGDDVVLSAAGERGKELARTQGCISCHSADGSRSTGPSWKGIAGTTVELEDGTSVVRDDAYLRTAIVASRGQVVDGYANIMPVYEGELTEAEIADLIAYLRDLAPAEEPTTTG